MLEDCGINLPSSRQVPFARSCERDATPRNLVVTCVSEKRVTFNFAMNFTHVYTHGRASFLSRGNESSAATRSGVFIDQLS
jgi:hypothetical protein